jgi:hypothetical protein
MSQYSVDIFDMALNLVHHDILEDPVIDDDRLAPNITTIEIKKTTLVPASGYVHLDGDIVFDGIIDAVSDDEDITKIDIKPLICAFDRNIPINLSYQKSSTSLEAVIRSLIQNYWVNDTTDILANMPMTATIIGDTRHTNWTLDLEARNEEVNKTIVNLLNDVIIPAFERYGIVVNGVIDFVTMLIDFTIENPTDYQLIDADNPMVHLIEFMPDKMDGEVNRLTVVNADDYSERITYYLHPNGTYNTTNNNRITPVVFDFAEATKSSEEGATFADAASAQADSVFGKIKYKNYVEFETQYNDLLINPLEIKMGSKATIYHNGQTITTMLTGRIIDEMITLTFGTVRLDYTKQK